MEPEILILYYFFS